MEKENFVICWNCGDFFDIEKSIYDKEFNICNKCVNSNYEDNDNISSDNDSLITVGEHDIYDDEYECNDNDIDDFNNFKTYSYDSDNDLNSYTIYTN